MDQPAPLPALVRPAPPDAMIAALAERYQRANGGAVALLSRLGGKLEAQMAGLPPSVQRRIEDVTTAALTRAYGIVQAGPVLGPRRQMALTTFAGAAGGFAGLPGAVAELPVTVTLILRGIQDVAVEHGFDPAAAPTRRETLRVFGAGSPLAADDGVNSAFIGARLTFTGPAVHRLIATVAPRVATALGQKLAAQAVPVLGALAGAGLNATYTRYFREMAHVRFGLLTLALAHDPDRVLAAFCAAAEPPRITRAGGPSGPGPGPAP